MREVVERSATMLQRILPTQVRVTLSIPEGTWLCELDRGQLHNALLNLVVNASHALDGQGQVTLELADGERGNLRLSVVDDGPGMSAEVLARAIEPFFTTKEIGSGTGLGLAMVDAFARDCGGEMVIETASGEGCRVTLVLPRA